MKRLFIVAFLTSALAGCAVLAPYGQPYDVYASAPVYPYTYPYSVVPGPVYGPPVYVGPPINFSFGLGYWSGGGHHHGFGGHPHGGWGGHGGRRGGWRR